MGTEHRSRAAQRFEDLAVWQTARELARGVYRAAESQAVGRDYAMLNQMKRAAVSTSSNIAEGYERGTRRQHIEACYVAKGSAGELRSQIIVAHDVGLLDDVAFAWLMEHCDKVSRHLASYLRHLQRSQRAIPGMKYIAPPTDATPREGEKNDPAPV
ncbi:MAG: four helix bundle protein [Planctomycetota bacterium]